MDETQFKKLTTASSGIQDISGDFTSKRQALKDISPERKEFFRDKLSIGQEDEEAKRILDPKTRKFSIFKGLMERLSNKRQDDNKGQTANVSDAVKDKYEFNRDVFQTGILHAENRGAIERGDNLYEVIGETGDLGKYQVNPEVLKDWSGVWLDRNYTPEEFLKDPEAQEEFFNQFQDVVERYKLTPEEAAITWHRGWGELGTGDRKTREKRFRDKLKQLMKEDKSKEYLSSFKEGISKNNEAK